MGPAFKDQFREANSFPRPAAPHENRSTSNFPLADATPVSDCAIEAEQRQMDLEERLRMVARFEFQQQQQRHHQRELQQPHVNQPDGPSLVFTKKQWLIVGVVILLVMVAASVAIAAFATGNRASPEHAVWSDVSSQTNTDPATSSGIRPTISTMSPSVAPESWAPVLVETATTISPTSTLTVSPTLRPSAPRQTLTPTQARRSEADVQTILIYINALTFSAHPLSYPSQSTPQERALQWLIEQDLVTHASNLLALQQRFILATIYFANGPFDSNHTKTPWLTSTYECDWESISCDSWEVTAIWLGSDRLRGTIPADIGHLKALTDLELHDNRLTGTIPSHLALLTSLTHLFLGRNGLTGTIPTELGKLTTLAWLDLQSNQVSGSIPSQFISLTSLTRFFVEGNNLAGRMPFCDGDSSRFTELSAYCVEVDCDCCTTCCTNGVNCDNN